MQLRHHEVGERTGGPDDLVTIGVMLTPNNSGRRQWDTTLVRPYVPSELMAEELTAFSQLWNGSSEADEVSDSV
ncbi:hypothetical protein ACTWQF_25415 [Streptomyces sp. 8N114]